VKLVPVTWETGQVSDRLASLARAPFVRRAFDELSFCAAGVALGVVVLSAPAALSGLGLLVSYAVAPDPPTGAAHPPAGIGALVWLLSIVALLLLAPRIARALGTAQRRLAARLLGERIPAPPPIAGRAPVGWLRDGYGWRALAYLVVRLPLAVFQGYAVFCYVAGLVNLSYPFWWRLFRNHPPNVQLDPVRVATVFGSFRVATFAGTFAAFAAGAGMLLAAPWIARGCVAADRALMRGLLGPGRLAKRLRDLEETRALAVDDSAAILRRVERDLHDGAQARLAALAMNLGRVREELAADGDLGRARELVDVAHASAKDALVELRDLARGIHPPVLDNGLADALASLAAGAAVPVRLTTRLPERPTPAIEAIAYFCAAELLANAVKHSHAGAIAIDAALRDGALVLTVTDDGVGGASPAPGGGLTGLAQRVRTVDGDFDLTSPHGGPTRVTVRLPLRA
jgi:signal transduction histidine kinase